MVSIVLVTYNRAHRLKLSIEDILCQTYRNFELIICDDCSTDGTESLCREYAESDDRIRYFRHASNQRMPGNLNFGIQQARSEYIAILHDGDRFRRDLIEQWHNAISANDNVGFVFCSKGDTDPNDRFTQIFAEFDEGVIRGKSLLRNVFFKRTGFDSPVYGETMVRKSLVEQYGYFKEEFSFYADVDLWMGLLHEHDAYYCADTLLKCPLKSFEPQQFFDDIVRFTIYLFTMHSRHRRIEFRENKLRLFRELTMFYAQTVIKFIYVLLIVMKNHPFDYYIKCRKQLSKFPYLYVPWAMALPFYPIARGLLRLIFRKDKQPRPSADERLAAKSDYLYTP